ncbi:MAG: hypothetical protein ABJD68_18435, partial [Nakamurella sp.]
MPTGTVHELARDLFLIEGHHPHTLWEDPDIPTIAVHRIGLQLDLLDTGVGPDQPAAIKQIADRLDGSNDVLLPSSHGHLDGLGQQRRAVAQQPWAPG